MKPSLREAAFGGFDGTAGAAGLVAGALVAHVTPHAVLLVGVASAVANAFSMAGDDLDDGKSWRLALAMFAGTLAGALAPVIPVAYLHGATGAVVAALTVAGVGAVIAEVRRNGRPRWRAYSRTFAMLLIASTAAVLATVCLGATG